MLSWLEKSHGVSSNHDCYELVSLVFTIYCFAQGWKIGPKNLG